MFVTKNSVLSKVYNRQIHHKVRFNSNHVYSTGITVDIPKAPIHEVVLNNITKWPQHVASECAITGKKYTYTDILDKTKNFDRSLRKKLKLNKGDVLAILLPNTPEYSTVVLGALKAGLVITTLNPIYGVDEIKKQLDNCGAKAIVTTTDLCGLVKKCNEKLQKKLPILAIKNEQSESLPNNVIDINEFFEPIDFPEAPPTSADDLAILPYSSGTTGLPKGVELTHSNLVSNLCQALHPSCNFSRETTSEHQHVVPAVLPKFHIYGFSQTVIKSMYEGSKTVTLPRFTPQTYTDLIKKYKPHLVCVAPPTALFIADYPFLKAEDLDSIETIVCGAAPLGFLDEERLKKKLNKNVELHQAYGLTETSPFVLTTKTNEKAIIPQGCTGKPIPNTFLKIVDITSGEALGPNASGELLVKGPQVMRGYYKNPEETEKIFRDDWLRTGDIAYHDENGWFFITDRIKELIKVKGFQVAPAELEEVIRSHPDVIDAAVIGIPDAQSGELPKAFVVSAPGKTVNTNELDEYVSGKVAPYKQLKGGIQLLESIPKNPSGKILRRALKEKYVTV